MVTTKLKRTNKSTLGTRMQGGVIAAHSVLVRRFGKPVNPRDPKVDIEWRLQSPSGVIVTIYRRADIEGKLVRAKDTDIWRVGGHSIKAVRVLREVMPRYHFIDRGGQLLLPSGDLKRQKRRSVLRQPW